MINIASVIQYGLTFAAGTVLVGNGSRAVGAAARRVFAGRAGQFVQRLGRHDARAALLGLGLTSVAPSATLMTSLAGDWVQSGLLSQRAALAASMGAGLGATVALYLLAGGHVPLSALMLCAAAVLARFERRLPGLAGAALGMGVFFAGLDVLNAAMHGAEQRRWFHDLLGLVGGVPPVAVLYGTLLALVLSSSNAGASVALGLAGAGLLPLGPCLLIVMGANVGAALGSWQRSRGSGPAVRGLMWASLKLRVFTGLLLAGLLALIHVPAGASAPMLVAVGHSAFNLLAVLLSLLLWRGRPAEAPRQPGVV